ncbi:MAG: cytochrome c peroxidase [Planctomycetota bacterium]
MTRAKTPGRSIPAFAITLLVGLTACGGGTVTLDRAAITTLFGKEHLAASPAPDAALVAFGKELYHDKRLSTKGNIACASCHDLARYGTDGQPTSPGTEGKRGDRNSPSSVNAFRQFVQFWDGRAKDVEEQATGPVCNPVEHGFANKDEFEAKLKSLDGMQARFAKFFPGDDPVTLVNFGKAVGAFERTLVTHSRFDDWLDGKDDALTNEEKKGLKTFVDTGCTMCHNGRTVGGGMYQKLGLVNAYPTEDVGRSKISGNDAEKFFFKVPMLLNVAKTAPYFHDGKVATLEQAVKLMAHHQLGKELSDADVKSIVTFLGALTGDMPKLD